MWALGQGHELAPPFSYSLIVFLESLYTAYNSIIPLWHESTWKILFYYQTVNFEQFNAIWRVLYKKNIMCRS